MTAIEQSSLLRVEHAQEPAYLESYQRLQSTLLKFEEGLNGDGPQSLKKDQSLRLLSLREVCQRLGADRGSIYQVLINGELPCYKIEDNIKIRQADLEEYMEAG